MKPVFNQPALAALAAICCLAGLPAGAANAAQTASGAISSASASASASTSTSTSTSTLAPAAALAADAASALAAPAGNATAAAAPAPAPATPEQQAALAGARPATATPMPAPTATGSLLQTIFALIAVLGVLMGLAWLLKRYGPKSITGGANVRLVGALSVGARERILVVEVGEQWIVVGASPGRMNALATMPRQESEPDAPAPQHALPSANFAEWFKQTIEKRNGK